MNTHAATLNPEALHPALWRASQLGRSTTKCVETGYTALSNQLPGGGWPTGSLTELLTQQPGIGEMRLLAPALGKVAKRKIVMLEPPHPPQALALAAMGVAPDQALWLRAKTTADTLWAAEQVLRSGACGALLLWQTHVRQESLRRLHLAAQAGETLCFVFRPVAAAQDASVAPLRLALRPAAGGLDIGFVKRRGPSTDQTLFLPMSIGSGTRPMPQRHPAIHSAQTQLASEHVAEKAQKSVLLN
ncbi:translesion DNA synthesis-associated protein ImuA [Massilia phyllosphaerae]|uniref:translesion DNA synthesis-associated protein ImuA n=1 Tax=Massilia phyllosphaerae TaxID=3106034 RepID=UPI002B1CD4A9|nr:translesion DNA synthesis-associated protein ImuA [Massilia sp. SGZ-792]